MFREELCGYLIAHKKQEEKQRFLTGKETQVMHLFWMEETDLSLYGIQGVMHRGYLDVYDSATIENQLYSLEKKTLSIFIFRITCYGRAAWLLRMNTGSAFAKRSGKKTKGMDRRGSKGIGKAHSIPG